MSAHNFKIDKKTKCVHIILPNYTANIQFSPVSYEKLYQKAYASHQVDIIQNVQQFSFRENFYRDWHKLFRYSEMKNCWKFTKICDNIKLKDVLRMICSCERKVRTKNKQIERWLDYQWLIIDVYVVTNFPRKFFI